MPRSNDRFEREQEQQAASEAAAIGGRVTSAPPDEDDPSNDPAQRPLIEAGEGESEGFEEAERELVQHASHGDYHAAGRICQDASDQSEDPRQAIDGEADGEPPQAD